MCIYIYMYIHIYICMYRYTDIRHRYNIDIVDYEGYMMDIWWIYDLVGGIPTPLKKIRVRQLGWWLFPIEWKNNKSQVPVTTSQSVSKSWNWVPATRSDAENRAACGQLITSPHFLFPADVFTQLLKGLNITW